MCSKISKTGDCTNSPVLPPRPTDVHLILTSALLLVYNNENGNDGASTPKAVQTHEHSNSKSTAPTEVHTQVNLPIEQVTCDKAVSQYR